MKFLKRQMLPEWYGFGRIDWVLLLTAVIICFFTMYYADITVTARFSMTYLDSLSDGRLLSFYDNALATGIAPEGAVYDIGMYVLFAVWGLPVWLLQKVFIVDFFSLGCLLWFKLFLVLAALISGKQVQEIVEKLHFGQDIHKQAGVFYLLSFNLLLPVLVVAQYDILPVVFILYGVRFYLEKEDRKFILCFAVAMTMKPFAVLPFIALVLLKEKRILHITIKIFAGLLPVFICKVTYSLFSEGYRISCGSFLEQSLPALLKVSVSTGNTEVSLFCLALFGIYIYSYSWKEGKDSRINSRIAVMVVAGVWAVFSIFAAITPYWIVYLAPFLTFAVFIVQQERIELALILDLFINLSFTVIFIMKYSWVYGGSKTYSYLIFKPLYDAFFLKRDCVTVAGILRKFQVETVLPVIGAMLSISITYLMLLGFWGCKEVSKDFTVKINPWHFRIRVLCLYGWICLCSVAFILGILGY